MFETEGLPSIRGLERQDSLPRPKRFSSRQQISDLWKKAIREQILLIRMDKENRNLQGETRGASGTLSPLCSLKAMHTFGNCQRPVFSLGVSQHMHQISNLCKFELNWSSKLRESEERKKHPCWMNLCAFRYRNKRLTRHVRLEVFNYFSEKLPLSQNLCYFRVSHFLLSTAL